MNFEIFWFWNRELNYENLSLATSIFICFLMGSFYVLSLYLWSKQNRYNRNEPSVIKRRFISVLITCLLSFILIYLIASETQTKSDQLNLINKTELNHQLKTTNHPIYEWIGFKFDIDLIKSCLITIILTVILFTGPILQHFLNVYLFSLKFQLYEYADNDNEIVYDSNNNNYYKQFSKRVNTNGKQYQYHQPQQQQQPQQQNLSSTSTSTTSNSFQKFIESINCSFRSFKLTIKSEMSVNLKDLCFWRNYVISPFTEEFVFRSCMLPLLVPHLNLANSILVTPLFFGLAHLHHIIEGIIMNDSSLKSLCAQHLFQFAYTYIFGVYSSYLFLRTGNFFSSFLSHSFCNLMGFPNVKQLVNDFDTKFRVLITIAYFFGLVLFFLLIETLTEPSLFNNNTYQF